MSDEIPKTPLTFQNVPVGGRFLYEGQHYTKVSDKKARCDVRHDGEGPRRFRPETPVAPESPPVPHRVPQPAPDGATPQPTLQKPAGPKSDPGKSTPARSTVTKLPTAKPESDKPAPAPKPDTEKPASPKPDTDKPAA